MSNWFDIYFDEEHIELNPQEVSIEDKTEYYEISTLGNPNSGTIPGKISKFINFTIETTESLFKPTIHQFSICHETGFIMVDRENQILYDSCYLESIEYLHKPGNHLLAEMHIGFDEGN